MCDKNRRGSRGGILIMTLVFIVMFVVIFIGLSGLVTRSYHEAVLQANDEQAFQIAENGLDYARWRLAHDPTNFTSESREVSDPFGGSLGYFDVVLEAPPAGGTVVGIESTGYTNPQTAREVVLRARYGKPSLARYASITNDDVWYGGSITGAVHANGGIRMDGNSGSIMTSLKETYKCRTYHGCTSPWQTKPGIWGTGTTQELWEFPVAQVDYNSLTADLLDMKDAAEAANYYYGDSGAQGYQIVFNNDNTFTISRVNSLASTVLSYWDNKWKYLSHDVGSSTILETRPVPTGGIIFVEDTLWLRGDVRDRVTVAAGKFPDTPASNVDIILNGNISYDGVKDGSRAFAAIAQGNVLIPWSGAPNNMVLDGAFVAQRGSFHRRYYPNCCGSQAHHLKNSLTRYGMLASNGVPATTWVDGGGNVTSGFLTGTAAYDQNFLYNPPPFFPDNGQYEVLSWEEEQ